MVPLTPESDWVNGPFQPDTSTYAEAACKIIEKIPK